MRYCDIQDSPLHRTKALPDKPWLDYIVHRTGGEIDIQALRVNPQPAATERCVPAENSIRVGNDA
jgi:hypothetical protein